MRDAMATTNEESSDIIVSAMCHHLTIPPSLGLTIWLKRSNQGLRGHQSTFEHSTEEKKKKKFCRQPIGE